MTKEKKRESADEDEEISNSSQLPDFSFAKASTSKSAAAKRSAAVGSSSQYSFSPKVN